MSITVVFSEQEAQVLLGILERVPIQGTQGMALILNIKMKIDQAALLASPQLQVAAPAGPPGDARSGKERAE